MSRKISTVDLDLNIHHRGLLDMLVCWIVSQSSSKNKVLLGLIPLQWCHLWFSQSVYVLFGPMAIWKTSENLFFTQSNSQSRQLSEGERTWEVKATHLL